MDKIELKELLSNYNSEHLAVFFDELNEEEKKQFLQDVQSTDFEQVQKMFDENIDVTCEDVIEPIKGKSKETFTTDKYNEICSLGKQIIESGKYAVVTMAGGQGTRLGHTGPKGTFKLDFKDKSRYIFEIFVDNLKEAHNKYKVYVPWYIMTSKENNDETVKFFEENNYFGYPKDKITFFKQGELPITDMEGNVLLESKSKICKAADGNGGVFNALATNNILETMKEQNVEWILVTGIDNILVNIADEFYIGLVSSENKLNGVKSIAKSGPEERVGVFCRRNGKPSVIEYSEMNDDMKNAKDESGELKYIEANIVNHLFNIQVLEKIKNEKLPIHKAIKKINHIDKEGNYITPDKPCLIKYEAFIFDYFNMVDDVTIYRVNRNEEFAPVKNKEGEDSPMTATKLYNDLYCKEV